MLPADLRRRDPPEPGLAAGPGIAAEHSPPRWPGPATRPASPSCRRLRGRARSARPPRAARVAPDRRHPGRQGRHRRRHHRRRLPGAAGAVAADRRADAQHAASPYFYQLLHAAGHLPAERPADGPGVQRTRGQLTVEQLIDRYGIACRPVRDLLVDYLRERQPARRPHHAAQPGRLQPGPAVLARPGTPPPRHRLAAPAPRRRRGVEAADPVKTVAGQARRAGRRPPRCRGGAADNLVTVRAFYLDIAQWAIDDPARWGPWAAPCPIRAEDVPHGRNARRRKSRMDQRTRERLPVLPALVAAVDADRARTPPRPGWPPRRPPLPASCSPPPGRRCAAPVMARHGTAADLGRGPGSRQRAAT